MNFYELLKQPVGRLQHQLIVEVPIRAKPWSRSGKDGGRSFQTTEDRQYQKAVYVAVWEAAVAAGLEDHMPWTGPVELQAIFFLTGAGDDWMRTAMTKRPDKDNLVKNILDAVSLKAGRASTHRGILWDDDIVTDSHCFKRYGPKNCIVLMFSFYDSFINKKTKKELDADEEFEKLMQKLTRPEIRGRVPGNWRDTPQTVSEVRDRPQRSASLLRTFTDARLENLEPS